LCGLLLISIAKIPNIISRASADEFIKGPAINETVTDWLKTITDRKVSGDWKQYAITEENKDQ
jgi:hypothetical protein